MLLYLGLDVSLNIMADDESLKIFALSDVAKYHYSMFRDNDRNSK